MSRRSIHSIESHYKPIADYGVIGDLRTVALVGKDGSIDFMCFPGFDSPTIFAALLDHKKGGSFKLAPVMRGRMTKQLYLPESNILLSRFLSNDGVAEISDFMPITDLGHPHAIVRRAKAVRGDIRFRMVCDPRFDYGRAQPSHPKEKARDDLHQRGSGQNRPSVAQHSATRVENGAARGRIHSALGQTARPLFWRMRDGRGESPSAGPDYVSESFKQTMNFWQAWIQKSQYRGRWREMVNRSALTLKLLTSARYGSIVAAPTFGLPEEVGGVRNWDYRYTWIRDASFTLYALMRLGYTEEATAFMRWIEERCRRS